MIRVLRIYWHFFSWQRTLLVVTTIGFVMAVAGLALPIVAPARVLLGILGTGFAFFFMTIFSAFGYRQLISNRRFVLVPAFRLHASLALLLVAVTSTAATALATDLIARDIDSVLLTRLSLLTFTAISAFLLIVQWLVTCRLGLFAFALFPVIAAYLGALVENLLAMPTIASAALAGAAGLGWLWLIIESRGPGLPAAIGVPGLGSGHDEFAEARADTPGFLAFDENSGNAAATLMRGMSDGWRTRFVTDSFLLLVFPLGMLLMFRLFGFLIAHKSPPPLSPGFFLIWSLVGVNLMSSLLFGEWPLTARKLWLRSGGDRDGVWRIMERSLLADTLASAIAASAVAVAVVWLTDVAARTAMLYVAGVALSIPTTTYVCFFVRALGWNRFILLLILIVVAAVIVPGAAIPLNGQRPDSVLLLLPILVLIALGFRALARWRMRRIDWCAVRPVRLRRRTI